MHGMQICEGFQNFGCLTCKFMKRPNTLIDSIHIREAFQDLYFTLGGSDGMHIREAFQDLYFTLDGSDGMQICEGFQKL